MELESLDLGEFGEWVLEETDYVEKVTRVYSELPDDEGEVKESVLAMDQEDLEVLRKLEGNSGMEDVWYADIGRRLDSLDERNMINRDRSYSTFPGNRYANLTPASRMYLDLLSEYSRRC